MPKLRSYKEQLAKEQAYRAAWLRRAARRYKSQTEMARSLGIERTYMIRTAKRLGVQLPVGLAPRQSRHTVKDYLQCVNAGMTARQTAIHLGVCISTVYKRAERHGFTFAYVRPGPKRKRPKPMPKPKPQPKPLTMADLAAKENAAMKRRTS